MFKILAIFDGHSCNSTRLAPRSGVLRPFWAHLSCRPQSVSHQPHVAQRKQRDNLRCVFDKTSVTRLAIAKLTLDDSELMLDLGPGQSLEVLKFFDCIAHPLTLSFDGFALRRLHSNIPSGFDVLGVFAFLNAGVSSVTKDSLFFAVNQFVCMGAIVLAGRCGFNTVNQARSCVSTVVSLHTKGPVVALFGLMHLRVPFATDILGRNRCLDISGINDGALLEQQTTWSKHRIDRFEESGSQLMLFKQVPKVQDGGLVWNATTGQRQTCELAHRLHVVEGFFHRRINGRKPLLHEVNPKHGRKGIRWTTAFALGINRFNQRTKSCPRNHLIHIGQEYVAPRLLMLGTEFNIRKVQLRHDRKIKVSDTTQKVNHASSSINSGLFSENP